MASSVKSLSSVCIMLGVAAPPHLRIGELSRRSGVSAELLRAWERRYGLLRPQRSQGGFRLYGPDDEERIHLMQANLAQGISAAEAARLALTSPARSVDDPLADVSSAPSVALERLTAALDAFDEADAPAIIDDVLARFTLDTVLRDVFLPYLHRLGERWARGEIGRASCRERV